MPTFVEDGTPGVFIQEVDLLPPAISAPETAVPAFIGFTETAPDDYVDGTPYKVTSWTQYFEAFGGFPKDNSAYLPYSVQGWFQNGGGKCYIVRIKDREPSGEPARLELTAAGAEDTPALRIAARVDEPVAVSVEPGSFGDEDTGDDTFDLRIRINDQEVAAVEGLTLADAAAKVEADPKAAAVVTVEEATGEGVPVFGRYPLEPAAPTKIDVNPTDFQGNEADRSGIDGLVIAEDVTILVCPDLKNLATSTDDEGNEVFSDSVYKSVQLMMINHCELQKNRLALLDAPPHLNPTQVLKWRTQAMFNSMFAAFYYPWIKVQNQSPNGSNEFLVPPSGHLAGVWANTDAARGVWKAPANVGIAGALGLETEMTHNDQNDLNKAGINALRAFGTRGLLVWGARTLTDNNLWQYIPVRRLFNMIETAIMNGTQWVVFEPNDPALWARVSRSVSAFLQEQWAKGALFGATPSEAFYVKCDAEINPPSLRDKGILQVEVGIAPVKPAEYVIFRISQWRPE